eukprot:SM000374S13847  [mRNA]  locus=s374:46542:47012:- [translate_table: standard]
MEQALWQSTAATINMLCLSADAEASLVVVLCPRSCRLVSNPSVRALCQLCPRLRYLSLQHCSKLSDDVLRHLLLGHSLRFVDLGRGRITSAAMEAYKLQRPQVELLIDGRNIPPSSLAVM